MAERPNALWAADITFLPTLAGFLYLAVVLDAWSRRIVGWAFSVDLKTGVVLDALDMAIAARKPDNVVHHSDRGRNTPRSLSAIAAGKPAFVRRQARSATPTTTMRCARVSSPPSNAELIDRRRFRSHSEARTAVFQFIEGFYNPSRRHSALGYLSPIEYEWTSYLTKPA